MTLAEQIERALAEVDVFASDTPNLNAWPQPFVQREFAEWIAARIKGAVILTDEERGAVNFCIDHIRQLALRYGPLPRDELLESAREKLS